MSMALRRAVATYYHYGDIYVCCLMWDEISLSGV